jgi:hypothetical protein
MPTARIHTGHRIFLYRVTHWQHWVIARVFKKHIFILVLDIDIINSKSIEYIYHSKSVQGQKACWFMAWMIGCIHSSSTTYCRMENIASYSTPMYYHNFHSQCHSEEETFTLLLYMYIRDLEVLYWCSDFCSWKTI